MCPLQPSSSPVVSGTGLGQLSIVRIPSCGAIRLIGTTQRKQVIPEVCQVLTSTCGWTGWPAAPCHREGTPVATETGGAVAVVGTTWETPLLVSYRQCSQALWEGTLVATTATCMDAQRHTTLWRAVRALQHRCAKAKMKQVMATGAVDA